jgi:hypothetical protein
MKKLLLIALLSGSIASAWGAARPELETAEEGILKFSDATSTIKFTNATSNWLQVELYVYNPFAPIGGGLLRQPYPKRLQPGHSFEYRQYYKALHADSMDEQLPVVHVAVQPANQLYSTIRLEDQLLFFSNNTRSINFKNDNRVPLKFEVGGYTSKNVFEELQFVLQPGERYAVPQYFTDDNQFIVTAVTVKDA